MIDKKALNRKLSLPVYLNESLVIDLLAIFQGGFSKVKAVKTIEDNVAKRADLISSKFGVSNILSTLLNIDLSGSKSKDLTESTQTETAEERVFTLPSLFSKLRDYLYEREMLQNLDNISDFSKINPEDFVEFSANLQRNPMLETLDSLVEMMKISLRLSSDEINQNQIALANKPTGNKPKNNLQKNPEQIALDQFDYIRSMFSRGDFEDFLASIGQDKIKAVVTLNKSYFSENSFAPMIGGRFVVVGKVLRKIEENSSDSISFLRGTELSRLPSATIEGLVKNFSSGDLSHFKLPEVFVDVEGSVVQVIPIAIYI